MDLLLYDYTNDIYIGRIHVNVFGYGRHDLIRRLQSRMLKDGDNFHRLVDFKDLLKQLDGRLSKKSTGLLAYYYSNYDLKIKFQ